MTSQSLASVGERAGVVSSLAHSAEWIKETVDRMYADTLGRSADAAGEAYWVGELSSGKLTVAQMAADFYSSSEYFDGLGGGTVPSWVGDLYVKLLGRPADAAGQAFWVAQSAVRGRWWVAYQLFQSPESAHDRVAALYWKFLGRAPDQGGWDYWSLRVVHDGDLALAADLAASTEYDQRAWQRYGWEPSGSWQILSTLPSSSGWPSDPAVAFGKAASGAVIGTILLPLTGDVGQALTVMWPTVEAAPELLNQLGAPSVMLSGVSPSGEIYGAMSPPPQPQSAPVPVVWTEPSAAPSELVLPGGLQYSSAYGVASDGEVVGTAMSGSSVTKGVVWASVSDTTPTVLAGSQGLINPVPIGVSPTGVIYGNTSSGARIWTSPTASPVKLFSPGSNTRVAGVTAHGVIVGTATVGGKNHVFVWSSPSDHNPVELANPSGITATVSLTGVTPAGEIIGHGDNSPDGQGPAIIWASTTDTTPTVVAPPAGYDDAMYVGIDPAGGMYGSMGGAGGQTAVAWQPDPADPPG